MRNLKWWLALAVCLILLLASGSYADWTKTNLPGGGMVKSFAVVGTDLFAGTQNGVYRTSNLGVNWHPAGLTGEAVTDLIAVDGKLFAGTGNKVRVSGDLGATWTSKGPAFEVLSLAAGDGKIWMGTRSTTEPRIEVYYSTNSGEQWTAIGAPIELIEEIAGRGNQVFLATGHGVYVSEKIGSTYAPFYKISRDMWVTSMALTDTGLFAGVWYESDGMIVSQDFGSFQTAANNGLASRNLHTVFVDGPILYAGTEFGAFRSGNRGETWTPLDLSGTDVHAFARIGANLFAGTAAGVSVSTDDGANWTVVGNGLQSNGIASVVSRGDDLFLANSCGVFKSSDAGETWSNVGLSNTNITRLNVQGTTLLAGTRLGVYRSDDDGSNWTYLGHNGIPDWNLAVADMIVTQSGTLLAATENSGVYRSTDGGASWTAVSTGTGVSLPFHCLFTKGDKIFSGSWLGINRSTDDGATWTRVSGDGLATSQSPYHVSKMVVVGDKIYGGGYQGVFVSDDDGGTWTEIDDGIGDKWIRGFAVSGTDLYASTMSGIFVLKQNAAAWKLMDMSGLADTTVGSLAIVQSMLLAESQPGAFQSDDPTNVRHLWKRSVAELNCCTGTRGNVDQFGTVDLTDLSLLVNYLTGGGSTLPCPLAANVSGAGVVDLTDMSVLVNFLTGGGYVLPNCP